MKSLPKIKLPKSIQQCLVAIKHDNVAELQKILPAKPNFYDLATYSRAEPKTLTKFAAKLNAISCLRFLAEIPQDLNDNNYILRKCLKNKDFESLAIFASADKLRFIERQTLSTQFINPPSTTFIALKKEYDQAPDPRLLHICMELFDAEVRYATHTLSRDDAKLTLALITMCEIVPDSSKEACRFREHVEESIKRGLTTRKRNSLLRSRMRNLGADVLAFATLVYPTFTQAEVQSKLSEISANIIQNAKHTNLDRISAQTRQQLEQSITALSTKHLVALAKKFQTSLQLKHQSAVTPFSRWQLQEIIVALVNDVTLEECQTLERFLELYKEPEIFDALAKGFISVSDALQTVSQGGLLHPRSQRSTLV